MLTYTGCYYYIAFVLLELFVKLHDETLVLCQDRSGQMIVVKPQLRQPVALTAHPPFGDCNQMDEPPSIWKNRSETLQESRSREEQGDKRKTE